MKSVNTGKSRATDRPSRNCVHVHTWCLMGILCTGCMLKDCAAHMVSMNVVHMVFNKVTVTGTVQGYYIGWHEHQKDQQQQYFAITAGQ